jgi:hypothetical protein
MVESARGVKFAKGVVGKTNQATLALFGLWALILWRLSSDWLLDVCLLFAGGVATAVYCWWVHKTQKFAKENPAQALLEGAQFVEYQKWEAAVKGLPRLASEVVPDPNKVLSANKANDDGSAA